MPLPLAFVMMPFSDELRVVFEQLIQPALAGFEVIRADSRLDERGILEKIITGIRDADLVIADITNTNPNVMYELGIAHTLGKPTIMIAQSADRLPFDIRSYPVHEYSAHFAQAADLTRVLRELSERHLAGELLFANPVTDFIPALREEPRSPAKLPPYSVDECVRDLEGATELIAAFSGGFSAASARFRGRMDKAVSAIGGMDATNQGLGKAADSIRELARELIELASPLHEAWELFARANAWLLAPPQFEQLDYEARKSFGTTAVSIDETLNEIVESIANLRAANDNTPVVTGNLGYAVETAHDAMTRLLNEIMTGKAHLARAIHGFVSPDAESV